MNQRDVELLSAYLDGQLKPSDSARLEARLKSEPALVSVLDDLREARGLLRRLPARKAPRNFALTRKMVGLNPPMPRVYPAFRWATTLATLLLFFTFGLNFIVPQLASQQSSYGMGGGGGEAVEPFSAQAPMLAATEAPVESSVPAPAQPSLDFAPQPTPMPTQADATRQVIETPFAKSANGEGPLPQNQSQVLNEKPFIPSVWQMILAGIAIMSALLMVLMRQLAVSRWRQK